MSEEKENFELATESTEKKKFELTPKAKKIINIVVDVVCGAILLFALLLAICTIRSKAKGYSEYTEIFGKAYIAASSDSMDAKKPEGVPASKPSGFKKGDLLTIKTLSAAEAAKLEVGDVITFQTTSIVKDKRVLNTHRIIQIDKNSDGVVESYRTQGDNREVSHSWEKVQLNEIVGIYQKKSGGIGHLFLFMNSSAGFFVCIVLPTLIVVAYCVVNLILVIRKEKKAQTAAAIEEKAAEDERMIAERERIRAELLAEMQGNNAVSEPAQKSEDQPEAVVVAEEVNDNKEEEMVEAPVEEKTEEVKAEEINEKPVEKKAKPAAKSASTKATGTKPAAKSASAKTASAKPAASKTTGAKTAAKKTNKDSSEE